MGGEWIQTTLGAIVAKDGFGLVDGPFGSNLPASCYTASGIPVIRGSNLTLGTSRFRVDEFVFVSRDMAERLARSLCRPLDIVFTKKGTLGQTGLVPEGGPYDLYLLSSNQMKLTVDRRLADPLFVYYFVSSPESTEKIIRDSEATGVPKTNVTYLRDFPITLPPLPEQRAIAHILGTLDDKIELNRRMNETLEAMARAIFQSWFVDFDPVRAKAEGRNPGLPKHLADLFPASFEESKLGQIPKGWPIKTISDVAERVGMGPFGSSIKVETFVSEGIPVISGQHLHGTMLEDNSFNFITPEHAVRLRSANVQRGDIVFTHAGNIGQAAFIPENSRYERYVISQRQFFMRCDLTQVTPNFIAFYFNSPEGQHRLLANTSSSGVPSIARPVTYLRSIELVVPPKTILDAFERTVHPLLFQFRENLDESDTLAALRDTLLPKLLSGELRVTAACKGPSYVRI